MQYSRIGNLRISRILNGLWQIADRERNETLDPTVVSKQMVPFVEAGFTTFDMADHYGSAEIITGHFRSQLNNKDSVQLLTKWVPTPRITSKDQVRAAVEKSLKRLQTDQIDLMQYHAWNYVDPEWLDSLWWLQGLKQEGLIKELGVTNFDANHLRIACTSGIELVSNQISYSILDTRAQSKMQDICTEFNISILAFGTLAGGFLTERWLDKVEPLSSEITTWSQMKYKRYIDAAGGWQSFQQLLKVLSSIAHKHNCSIANVATHYILNQNSVAGAIIGSRLGPKNYIQQNIQTLTISLDEEDYTQIHKAQSVLHPIPGGCGDEYRKPPFLTASGDLSHHIESLPKVYTPIKDGNKIRVDSGTIWEPLAGYSRAIRKGHKIYVSGTTATHGEKLIGANDPAAQTHFIIDKINAALESLGGCLEDVDRTRIYISDMQHWEAVARAHGERFKQIRPANTMVQAALIGQGYLVEIEAEASCVDP